MTTVPTTRRIGEALAVNKGGLALSACVTLNPKVPPLASGDLVFLGVNSDFNLDDPMTPVMLCAGGAFIIAKLTLAYSLTKGWQVAS